MINKLNQLIFPCTLVAVIAVGVFGISHVASAAVQEGGGGGGGTAPTITTLSVSPTPISAGSSATLTWGADKGTCSGTNFTPSARSGSLLVTPTVTTTYSLTCSNVYGSDFASVTLTVNVAAGTVDLTAGGVTPTTATAGTAATLVSSVSNSGSASTGAGFTNLFQRATDASGTSATDIGTHSATALAAGANSATTLSYTFPSAATWYVRVCADKNSAVSAGTITESNESNNCGAWTAIVVGAATVPVVTLSASPTSLSSGQSSTITWSSTGATSCTGTGFSTGNQTTNSTGVVVSPTVTTTYSISCTGTGGTGTGGVTVSVASAPTTTTYPGTLCSGGTYLGSSADTVNSCVAYCSGLTASCCSTYHTYGTYEESYSCAAYSGTTATVASNTTGGCTSGSGDGSFSIDGGGGGDPECTWTEKSATLISYGPAVTASLVSNPTSISAGQPALLTWSSENATTCTGTGFATNGDTLGSVEVSPSNTTTYSLSCTGANGTATDSETLTVDVFTVTCSATPNPVTVYQPVSWTSAATGGTGSYTYSWTGTDALSGTSASLSPTYTTIGEKLATLSVTSDGTTITTACNGTPCQSSSCTCSGAGCGVIVQEGVSADVTASIPTMTGSAFPGGSVTFGASIMNIGNNSISSVFSNRFQIDIGNDGTYDTTLDTGGSAGSQLTLEYGKTCQTGSVVATDSYQIYGAGDLSGTIQSLCEVNSVSGQCCGAVVTTGSSGGGGGGGGRGGTNLVEGVSDRNLAALYKSLALTYYDIAITVYSSPTKSTCQAGQTCYAGTWESQSGALYDIPFNTWFGVTSPSWTNIPGGTHKVRLCADNPTSQLSEVDEGNNCGPDYTFTVSGFDLTAGVTGLNTGQLVAGQVLTFFSTIINSPTSYSESGQCQATVVVSSGGACTISVNADQLVWSTTGATIVSAIDPLTSSPTVPATGSGGNITENHSEADAYNSQAVIADMANFGINLPAIQSSTGFAGDQATMDRVCVDVTGRASATASSWGARGYNSCGNNSIVKFTSGAWQKIGACSFNNHLSASFVCQYPGSPYALSGSYTFPSDLGVGTHTYQLTSNATAPNNTCQATIVVPPQSVGLCTLTADPSIIASGESSILTWTTNGASAISIDQGIGVVTPTAAGSTNVSPTVTKTYTGTATTDTTVFGFEGCAPSQFQIDTNNDGTWDTTLDAPSCLTSLDVNQSTQVVSPSWTAVVGTHAVRLCANTPMADEESDTDNNCGAEYLFTVANPTQCEDGIDNNGNGLIDLADPACVSGGDTSEQSFPDSTISLVTNRTTVKKGTAVTLTWTATDVVDDSCRITSSAGDLWTLTGSSGTQVTNLIQAETTYTLTCNDMQNDAPVSVPATVRLAPVFEEV